MRFLRLALVHARIAARQRALWVVSALLALLSLSITVNTGMPYETGDVSDLVFYAQMLALLPPIAYAAACTDLASAPERLGIGEIEDAAPVPVALLAAARVSGSFAVLASPSLLLLVLCGFGQLAHGNPPGPLQALALFATVVSSAVLLAMALSAFAGAVLPRAVARIAAVASWCALLAFSFTGVPVAGGGIQVHLVSDPVCQAFFGSSPFLDYQGPAVAATPVMAVALLALRLAVAAGLLASASAIARRRSYKHR